MNKQQNIDAATMIIQHREIMELTKGKSIEMALAHIKKHVGIDLIHLIDEIIKTQIESANKAEQREIFDIDEIEMHRNHQNGWLTNIQLARKIDVSVRLVNEALCRMEVQKRDGSKYLIGKDHQHVKLLTYTTPTKNSSYRRLHFHTDIIPELLKQLDQMKLEQIQSDEKSTDGVVHFKNPRP